MHHVMNEFLINFSDATPTAAGDAEGEGMPQNIYKMAIQFHIQQNT